MAYHQTGQRHPNQHQQYQGYPYSYDQASSTQANQNASIRNSAGFEPGDGRPPDSNMTQYMQAQYAQGYDPRAPSNYQDELHMSSGNPSYPQRTTSYTNAASAMNYQAHAANAAPNVPPAYNPQQYGAPQPPPQQQYSPQQNNAYSVAANAGYQSYNPAAYHQTAQSVQPPFPTPNSSSQGPLPPPPSRVYDQNYGDNASPASTSSAQFSNSSPTQRYRQQQPQNPTNSSATQYAYSQLPPPPPFSSSRETFSSHHSPSSSSQHSASYSSPTHDRHSSGGPGGVMHRPLPHVQDQRSQRHQQVPSPSSYRKPVGGNGSLPPTPGTPGPTPPVHRTDTNRHPHARPLPGPPSTEGDYFAPENNYPGQSPAETPYDDLMQEVEAAVMGRPPPSSTRRCQRDSRGHNTTSSGRNSYQTNGNVAGSNDRQYDLDAYVPEGDAEAEAGLAAMRLADEQDAADAARRQSGDLSSRNSETTLASAQYQYDSPASDDSEVNVDMTSYGGGFSAPYHYGDEPPSHHQPRLSDMSNQTFGSGRMSQRSNISARMPDVGGGFDYSSSALDYPQSFAPARVDTGGTGGLSEPSARPRRLSFEDGDESTLVDTDTSHPSSTTTPSTRDGLPEMFFHPSSAGGRPLPAAPMDQTVPQLMPAGTYKDPDKHLNFDEYGRPRFPLTPDAYAQSVSPSGTPVPRSSSLISHPSAPQQQQPIRSKTDADRARILRQQQQSGVRSASSYSTDAFGDAALNPSAELLGLPTIPAGKRRKFTPAKLSTAEFKRCSEPWALSSIVAWLKDMTEGEADLKEHAVIDGIVALFTHKVPTMNTADAETLGAKVVEAMLSAGTLIKDEEWVKFGTEEMSGVLFQLTGTGCYSSRVHTDPLPGRCYSHHCMRTLKKINLQSQGLEPQRKTEDWVTYYHIKKEDIEKVDSKEVERQNNLHEIITSEDFFMDSLNVVRVLYREELSKWNPPIIAPNKRERFLKDVFGNIDAVKQANEEFLLPQLKYRQQEQGPWIVGFSDIFREWIRKARTAYIDYAANLPHAVFLIRQESNRNLLFKQFLEHMQSHERSKRLDWQNYIKAPVTRLQRYSLLLGVVLKHMKKDSEEKRNLDVAIEEIKAVTMECNAKVDEMEKRVTMQELALKLKLRTGMDQVNLNLTHLGREVIFRGDVQRLGSTKMSWLDAHVILFDHYFVLAKIVEDKHPVGGEKGERYDISKLPIPMDLLVLESMNEDPVSKAKGLGGVANKTALPSEPKIGRVSVNGAVAPGLAHTDSATTIDGKEEKLLYPFRIRHLGRNESFALYTSSKQNRQEWCNKIIQAKTRHAESLFKQNAEPFRLRVIADTAFAYDAMTSSGPDILIRGTPLDRAIKEVEKAYDGNRPSPVCRAAVNCATSFIHPNGTKMLAIGTDYGVYLTESNNPRGWSRSITSTRVTQIAVLEEFSLFLLLTEKQLIAHHLDAVLHPSSSHSSPAANNTSTSHRAPQKLSGARDIGFFAHGRMKDRQLIFYKKREGVTSVFKVLEPIFQRTGSVSSTGSSVSMRNRLLGGMRHSYRGASGGGGSATETFRDFDEFYIGSETYAINLFHSSLAISTVRGIEVMTLDKKTPISIPDLRPPAVASTASRIKDMKPLGMFRLSESEFLLAYEEVGVYVNKHGDVSRGVIMEYVGRAKQACLVGGMYLILVDYYGLYVEVRNAINGRLRQVISGRDVRLLDDGGNGGGGVGGAGGGVGGGTVKICMQHPEHERSQVVLEMIVNEGLKE